MISSTEEPLFFITVITLLIFIERPSLIDGSSSFLIKGNKVTCTEEGQVMTFSFLKNPCITCLCRNSVVDCFEETCPEAHNCFFTLPNSTNNCCTQCKGCNIDGNFIRNGVIIQDESDSCRSYHCNSGMLTSYKSQCHVPCDKPIALMGQCCPSCNACPKPNAKDGEEMPNTSNDPCIRCHCFKGQQICNRQICPALPCPKTSWYQAPNSCCPVCRGKRHANQLTLQPNLCLMGDQTYNEDDHFTLDECTNCVCKNSTNICHRQTCPILSCEQDKQIRSAGQCCPKCSYENIGKMCIHKNRSYRHQESWKEQCQKCTCTDGTIECTTPKCDDFVCPSSYKKVKLDGECCDTCVQVDSTCVLKDGKILTYDRKRYHFDGKCNYVLTRECVDKSFSVHLVQKYLHSGQFEGQSLMVKIGDIKIYLSHLDRVRINQTLIQLPFIEINKFSIARIRNRIKLRSQLGFELLWVANKSVEMKVRNNFRSQLCGLCGNYNLDSEDEFQMKNSKKITTLDRFVKSFQVGQNVHCPRKRTQVPRRNMPILESSPWPQQAAARRLCLRIKARNTNCRNVNHSGDIYAQCLEDVVQCGDNRLCQCQVYEHLRNKCHSSNPNRPLDQSKCKSVQQCPPGSEFTACSLDCKRTCKNRHRSNNCSQQTCRPGCQCIGNRVWHQNQCIPEASCIS